MVSAASKYETRILVVDDVIAMCQALKGVLNKLGYKNVTIVQSGKEALEVLGVHYEMGEPFGLILCDWHMDGMSGLEVLKNIRSSPNLKSIPFVMVTSEGELEHVMDAVTSGVSHYIVKPPTVATLEAKLNQVLR